MVRLAALAALAATPLIAEPVSSHGGKLAHFLTQRAEFAASGKRVVIDRYCDSACLVFLSLPNACAMPGTVLGLHAAANKSALGGLIYANRLPDGMREFWLRRFLDEPSPRKVYRIKAEDAARRGWDVRICVE